MMMIECIGMVPQIVNYLLHYVCSETMYDILLLLLFFLGQVNIFSFMNMDKLTSYQGYTKSKESTNRYDSLQTPPNQLYNSGLSVYTKENKRVKTTLQLKETRLCSFQSSRISHELL